MRTPTQRSPQDLCQEIVRDSPWQVLCVCLMLNNTSGVQVRRVFPEFFRRWPRAGEFVRADPDEVKQVIRSLGFQNRRYERLYRMSCDYLVRCDGRDIREVYGVGRYAADSWAIFVEGRIPDDLEDKELRRYAEWARSLSTQVQPSLSPKGWRSLPTAEEAEGHGHPEQGAGRGRD